MPYCGKCRYYHFNGMHCNNKKKVTNAYGCPVVGPAGPQGPMGPTGPEGGIGLLVRDELKCLFSVVSKNNPPQTQERTRIGQELTGQDGDENYAWSADISSDGTHIAVGVKKRDNGEGLMKGFVEVYRYTGGAWIMLGLPIDGEYVGDSSSNAISLSADGSRVAIGAEENSDNGLMYNGHVRVHEYNADSDSWVQLGQDIDGDETQDFSGFSVDMSADGSRVVISAPFNDGGNGLNSGYVRVYEYDNTSLWIPLGSTIRGEAPSDNSGWSVGISADGTRIVIGTPFNDGDSGTSVGHVRIYEYNTTIPNDWDQLGQDIDGGTDNDKIGTSVSISGDGKRIAVGSVLDNNVSYVQVYKYDVSMSVWIPVGSAITNNVDDDFGVNVSLNYDGCYLLVAAAKAGYVTLYRYDGSAWIEIIMSIQHPIFDADSEDYEGRYTNISADGRRFIIGDGRVDDVVTDGTANVYELQISDELCVADALKRICALE